MSVLSVSGDLRSDAEAIHECTLSCLELSQMARSITHSSVLVRGWISAGIVCLCGPNLVSGRSQMRRLFACHHSSHSQFHKEQMSMIPINVTTLVFQTFFRQQEQCSSRHHVYTRYSIDTSNSNRRYGHRPGFQCLSQPQPQHGQVLRCPCCCCNKRQ